MQCQTSLGTYTLDKSKVITPLCKKCLNIWEEPPKCDEILEAARQFIQEKFQNEEIRDGKPVSKLNVDELTLYLDPMWID